MDFLFPGGGSVPRRQHRKCNQRRGCSTHPSGAGRGKSMFVYADEMLMFDHTGATGMLMCLN